MKRPWGELWWMGVAIAAWWPATHSVTSSGLVALACTATALAALAAGAMSVPARGSRTHGAWAGAREI